MQQQGYEQMITGSDDEPATTTHQYVSADGVMYCSREKTAEGTYQWRELKTADVYDAKAAPVAPTHRAAQLLRHQSDQTRTRRKLSPTLPQRAPGRISVSKRRSN